MVVGRGMSPARKIEAPDDHRQRNFHHTNLRCMRLFAVVDCEMCRDDADLSTVSRMGIKKHFIHTVGKNFFSVQQSEGSVRCQMMLERHRGHVEA